MRASQDCRGLAALTGPRQLTRISHTFCDTGAVRSEKVSRCKSLTAAGQADPFRQSVFQPSAGRRMDIGLPPQSASVFRGKCSPLAQCEKCGLTAPQQPRNPQPESIARNPYYEVW